jgi:hypothetical protein
MSFRHWFRRLRAHWADMVQSLWPPTPQQQRQREEDALAGRLQHHSHRLLRVRCRLERLRGRLERQQQRVHDLQSQVQECLSTAAEDTAWQRALILGRSLRRLQRTEHRLRRIECLYRRQRDRLDCCKGRLLALKTPLALDKR